MLLNISAGGAASGIDEHSDAHAAHEGDLLHVDDQPLESLQVGERILEGLRDDRGLAFSDGWRVNRGDERIGVRGETNEQTFTGVVDGSPPRRDRRTSTLRCR